MLYLEMKLLWTNANSFMLGTFVESNLWNSNSTVGVDTISELCNVIRWAASVSSLLSVLSYGDN